MMAALYVHIPARSNRRFPNMSVFTTALIQEMDRHARPLFSDRDMQTLYIGGDRPSRLAPSTLRTVFQSLRQTFGTASLTETTVELHPDDASPAYLEALRQLEVTRLSINARSFAKDELRALGASHSAEELHRILREARRIGFENTSVDLFFGGGVQSLSDWKTSLQRTVDLRVPHITIHERAPTENRHADDRAERLAFAMTFLDAKGYEQYELTHFARPGHRSKYQEHVYAHGNVLGLGPGAESFWWPDRTDPSTAERWSNVTDPEAYVERVQSKKPPVAHRETLAPRALAREYILLRLRTSEGLDLDVLEDRYDCPLRSEKRTTLDRLAVEGLIHDAPHRVRLTARGRLLTDAITRRLLPS